MAPRGESNRNFIIAAVTPEGDLYQLERYRTGIYAVYQVFDNGNMLRCTEAGFPAPCTDRDTAVEGFRVWGEGLGYEVFEG